MKPQDAYGAAPEEFKASIALALQRMEEEKNVKKPNYRLVICVALAVLLITGVVYAATRDWKLFDFYKQRYDMDITEEAQSAIQQNAMGQRVEVGDVVFTVQEAVADGRYLYLTAKAEPRKGDSAYLLGIMDSPGDWMTVDGKYTRENRRTYKRAALEDGKRLISAEAWAKVAGYEDNGGFADSVMLEDGSLRMIMGQEVAVAPGEMAIEIEFEAYTWEWVADEGGEDYTRTETLKESIRFTLPITLPIEQVTLDVGGKLLPGTAAQIDRCAFLVTPLSCYYQIEYTIVETEDRLLTAHSRNVLGLELVDEQGEVLPRGLTLGASTRSEDDAHFVKEGSVQLMKLPRTLILRPDDSWGAGPDDRLVLTIPAH